MTNELSYWVGVDDNGHVFIGLDCPCGNDAELFDQVHVAGNIFEKVVEEHRAHARDRTA